MSSNDEELRLSYLLSGSLNVLPDSYIKLRSYMNTYVADLADRHGLKLVKSLRNRNKTCPYCYSSWRTDTTTFILLPSKKSHVGQSKGNEEQMDCNSKLNKSRNTLVLRCRVCTKKSSFSLVKRKYMEEIPKEKKNVEVKKKKKKKDKSCSLNINLQKQNSNSPEILFVKEKKKRFSEETKTSKLANYQNSQSESSQKNKPIPKTEPKIGNKNKKQLILNPFANKVHNYNNKKNKKFERLKRAVKEEKSNTVKKTLQDFLTLI